MPVMFRVKKSVIRVASVLVATAPLAVSAQTAARTGGPEKGSWGAEAGVGRFENAAVLRFVSPSWALLAGGSFSTTNEAGSVGNRVPGGTTASIQVGVRKYHRSGLGFRPISGFGVAAGKYTGFGNSGGVYAEAGGVYLFNPHLSLGAVGVAALSRDGDQNTFTLAVPRVIASVFF